MSLNFMRYAIVLAVGIGSIAIMVNEHFKESTEISQGDRYDWNRSTTTVNRSSDLRDHRTLDSRPSDVNATDGGRYDWNKSTTTVNRSSDLRTHRTMDSRTEKD